MSGYQVNIDRRFQAEAEARIVGVAVQLQTVSDTAWSEVQCGRNAELGSTLMNELRTLGRRYW